MEAKSIYDFDYNPMNDLLFKYIFGKEVRKNITIDFLNAILSESLGHEIKDIVFAPSEKSTEFDGGRSSRLDVACKLDTNETVDVEMQVANQKDMAQRTLFYWSQVYQSGLLVKKPYLELTPVITVNLLGFRFLPQVEPHAYYYLINPKNMHRLSKDIEVHFLEIPKLLKNKSIKEMSHIERWLAFFSKKYKTQKQREELAMSGVALENAMEAARKFMADTASYRAYLNREMYLHDQASNHAAAFAEGRAEGLEEGRQEGLAEGEKKGEKKGESRFGALMSRLLSAKRYEDAALASSDEEKREAFYMEFGL